MSYEEIEEYPYTGTIVRVIQGKGSNRDTESEIYEGVMDEHMVTDSQGITMQTSAYIISIPLTKSTPVSPEEEPQWIIPRKGDKITLVRYGENIKFTVDNAEPSQLGGVSIYATRTVW